MIQYDKFTLENGLRVIVHEDHSTPMAAINILYDVGARDEEEKRTGFAHLFEHLMFGGSVNIPNYDAPLQRVGGENNAFTSNDITNYYITLPAVNLETGFWLESDRMLSLAFTPHSLEVQRQVVIEEFKQRYLNQPYGDVWLELRPAIFKKHPYKWATIGKEIKHIEEATLDEVKAFFKRFYHPGNAIMSVTGNVKPDQVKKLAEKWFGPIPPRVKEERNLPAEPPQTEMRVLELQRDVPVDTLYMAWRMGSRSSEDYIVADLLTDILSNGISSRFQQSLIRDKGLFSEVNAYITGDLDPGLFIISGKLMEGVSMETAEEAIRVELNRVIHHTVSLRELQKVKNKMESMRRFSDINILNKAMGLVFYELLGNVDLINTEVDKYLETSVQDLQHFAQKTLRDEQLTILYYRAGKA